MEVMDRLEMQDVAKAVESLPDEVKEMIGRGLELVEKETKDLLKKLTSAGFSVMEMEWTLDVLQGKDDAPGLLKIFGVKKPGDPVDPDQTDAFPEGERDFRTHTLTTEGVTELVAGIVADSVPVRAVDILNRLEEGERGREGGPRESVLKVIRGARAPVAKRAPDLSVANGGADG